MLYHISWYYPSGETKWPILKLDTALRLVERSLGDPLSIPICTEVRLNDVRNTATIDEKRGQSRTELALPIRVANNRSCRLYGDVVS